MVNVNENKETIDSGPVVEISSKEIAEIDHKAACTLSLHAKAMHIEVATPEASRTALELFTLVKDLRDEVEALRKKITQPWRKMINMVNDDHAKAYTTQLEEAEGILKHKLKIWNEYLHNASKAVQIDLDKLKQQLGVEMDIAADGPVVGLILDHLRPVPSLEEVAGMSSPPTVPEGVG
jgi:arginine utilization protein RocB